MRGLTLNELFPEGSRVLLSGGGREFIKRIGVEATRQAVLSVLLGENIRKQTEPLTRRRIAQVSGGMIALFARGWHRDGSFAARLSDLAVEQIESSKKNDKASIWLAQWLLGLTGKSVQNVLRSDPSERAAYISEFEAAVREAALHCQRDIGDVKMSLGLMEDVEGKTRELDWYDITRLTTAIGSLTLTLRGSDKSTYGKLFERLVLGTALTVLGFQRVNPTNNTKTRRVFWLSDSSDTRESDATVIIQPGKVVRFDIGFIGPGNSEISKDKLTRYARELDLHGKAYTSNTMIIVDRLPSTSKTKKAAARIGAEIIQMSMQYWLKDLALRLQKRLGYKHEIGAMSDEQIEEYLNMRIASIPIEDFLVGVAISGEDIEENIGE